MFNRIGHVTFWVKEQQQALDYYTGVLGFEKRQDDSFEMGDQGFRWVTVAPPGAETALTLIEPNPMMGEHMSEWAQGAIGRAPGLVLETDDIQAVHQQLTAKGVEFIEPPTMQPYGLMQAQFKDLYGNVIVLVEVPSA